MGKYYNINGKVIYIKLLMNIYLNGKAKGKVI